MFKNALFKNKLFMATPLITILVILLFSLTLFPFVQPQVKNLPIAVVNLDRGVDVPGQDRLNMGDAMVGNMRDSAETKDGADPAVQWITVPTEAEMEKGLDEQKYYAALVIPEDFSTNQASLRTPKPSEPQLNIYVNQGMNASAATAASQILTSLTNKLNDNVRTELLKGFGENMTLTAAQAERIATPINVVVNTIHGVGENTANGNVPVSLFQPIWIGCIAVAAILFTSTKKITLNNRKDNALLKLMQVIVSAISALLIGFGLTWLAGDMVGFNIPSYLDTALFISIASFSFIVMILAVLSIVGFGAIPVFSLLLFFGGPLLSMAPEMMSDFYREWLYSWLPMRFLVSGLREIFFFGGSLTWNTPLMVLVWISSVAIIVIFMTIFKPDKMKENKIANLAQAKA